MNQIHEHQNFIKSNIQQLYSINTEGVQDNLEKGGKPALAGEIREWNRRRYKKQANGKWLEISKFHETKKQHESSSTYWNDRLQNEKDEDFRKEHKEQVDTQNEASNYLSGREYDDSHFEHDENGHKIGSDDQHKKKYGSKSIRTTYDKHKFYYNKKGELHRDGDEPAIEWRSRGKEWYRNGKLHRDGDEPARIDRNGYREWHKDGEHIRSEGERID